jgi:acyl-CoA oxidase
LTERLAGVNSGLVVQTTATWDAKSQHFDLHSPSLGAYKNWISQGLTADKCCCIANLIIDGKSFGPHGFLMDLRLNGQVVPGVTLGDMGLKSTGNDLDNAWIGFNHVQLPKTALLNRFADIRENKYVQTTDQPMRIEVIGQRLLTGRVAVAQAALQFAEKLFTKTKSYAEAKLCWSPDGDVPLSSIPQLEDLLREGCATIKDMQAFCAVVEDQLCACLRKNLIPSAELVAAIAVAKVQAVERSIDLCFRLKNEVGSYALMGGSGFENMDMLQCCKFAEGDSRILMQKMARDAVRDFATGKLNTELLAPTEVQLLQTLASGGKKAWNANFRLVYDLAGCIIARTMATWLENSKKVSVSESASRL